MSVGEADGIARCTGKVAILYDLDCGLCRWSIGKVLAWDRPRRLAPFPIQGKEGERLLAAIDPESRLASWHLVSPTGEVLSAGAAVAPLLRLLPGGRPLAALAARAPGLVERLYHWVADHRALLGRFVSAGAKRRADERIARRRAAP